MESSRRYDEPVGLAGLAFEMHLDDRSPGHCSILCCRTPPHTRWSCDASDSGSERGTVHEAERVPQHRRAHDDVHVKEADCCSAPERHFAMDDDAMPDACTPCSPGSPEAACPRAPRRSSSAAEEDAEYLHAAAAAVAAGDRSPSICG